MKWDVWTQRLVAGALVICSLSLLIGTGAYAYREVSSLAAMAKAPALVASQSPSKR